MNRRSILSGLLGAAGGLVLPWEPRRVYSFLPPARTVAVRFFDQFGVPLATIVRPWRDRSLFAGTVVASGRAVTYERVDNYGPVETGDVWDGFGGKLSSLADPLRFNTVDWPAGSTVGITAPQDWS